MQGGGGQWNKIPRRGKGLKVVSYSPVGSCCLSFALLYNPSCSMCTHFFTLVLRKSTFYANY